MDDKVWTSDRNIEFRKLWGQGLPSSSIAKAMRCFAHCADGGRSAIAARARRMRLAADRIEDLAEREKERAFWTRRDGQHGASMLRGGPKRKRSWRLNFAKNPADAAAEQHPSTLKPCEAAELIQSTRIEPVRLTPEEHFMLTAREIGDAADALAKQN